MKWYAALSAMIALSIACLPAHVLAASPQVNTSFLTHLWASKENSRHWVSRRTIHVDVSLAAASDANPGTVAKPLKTLGAALKLAKPGTRIILHPGQYPESVVIGKAQSGTAAAPVIIEALKPGTAILTGSDVWAGWQPETPSGVYSHPWPYKWGVAKDPFAYAGATMKPLGRRSEMVFVQGKLLRQVLDKSELATGTFWVDENNSRITVQVSPGENLAQERVEVGVRKTAIGMGSVWGKLSDPHDWPSYYVLRGLSVEHYTGQDEYGQSAVSACGAHFLIEDCGIHWNNASGLTLRGTDIEVRGCRCNYNGSSGITAQPTAVPSIENALLEDVETSSNNWRGAMGEFYGFAVAGMKLMTSRSVVLRRFTSSHNASPGVWLDKDNSNYLIDHCRFIDNQKGPGLWLEISPGPFLVRDTVSAFNGDGVTISNSAQITLLRSTFYGNHNAQIAEWSELLDREGFYDFSTTLQDNVIVSTQKSQALWRRPSYPNIYDTLASDGNLWYGPQMSSFFIGTEPLDFSGWLIRTRQDAASVWAAPALQNPVDGDFRPRPGRSPLNHRGSWGTQTAVTLLPRRTLASADTKIYMASRSLLPIHYTLDGTAPGPLSPVYSEPFFLATPGVIKACVLGPNGPGGPVATSELIGVAPPMPDVSLSDLTPLKNVVGWGGTARKDHSIMDAPLQIDGVSFSHGMGAHAPSELVYDIPSGVQRFVSVVGVDDEVIGQADGKSSVTFEVYADGALLTKTSVLHVGEFRSLDVTLPAGSKQLRLVVTDGGNGQDWDHADWAQAGFVKSLK